MICDTCLFNHKNKTCSPNIFDNDVSGCSRYRDQMELFNAFFDLKRYYDAHPEVYEEHARLWVERFKRLRRDHLERKRLIS